MDVGVFPLCVTSCFENAHRSPTPGQGEGHQPRSCE